MSDNLKKDDLLGIERNKISNNLESCKAEKVSLNKRLDFFLDSSDKSKAESFRETYFNEISRLDNQIAEFELMLDKMLNNKKLLSAASFDMKTLLTKISDVNALLEDGNRAALKNLYRALFHRIWVARKNNNGEREITFELNSTESSYPGNFTSDSGKKCLDRIKMGWMTGLEPATTRITI
jgi:hypothetical protein